MKEDLKVIEIIGEYTNKNDRVMFKCTRCGQTKIDTSYRYIDSDEVLETTVDNEVVNREIGSHYWLCNKCYYRLSGEPHVIKPMKL